MDDGSGISTQPPPAPASADRGVFSVTSWNVNSIKTRLPQVLLYLQTYAPDIVLLQEIKTETENFPAFEIAAAGYKAVVKGQKSYNGVAVLSKRPVRLIADTLPQAPELADQARYLEVEQDGKHFICVYVPNGEPSATDPDSSQRLDYKINWLDALNRHIGSLIEAGTDFVIGGDFNVIEFDRDVYNPAAFKGTAFTVPQIRQRFKALLFNGLTNALREKANETPLYSYWDYRFNAWEKNDGILLDHLLLSGAFADKLDKAGVDSAFRGKEKASDHAPVWCSFTE